MICLYMMLFQQKLKKKEANGFINKYIHRNKDT